jgi:hypothetical protein
VTLFALANLWMARRYLLTTTRRSASVMQEWRREVRAVVKNTGKVDDLSVLLN